jgi:hypothetical protein
VRHVLALDPGRTTGYALASCNDVRMRIAVNEREFTLDEMYHLLDRIRHHTHAHVIYEDFSYRNYARMGLDLTPVKMIAIIELFRERYEPFVTFTKQTAAQGKNFYTDAKLRDLGVYKSGRKHGRDATRHLLYWINFGAGGEFIRGDEVAMELA